MVTFGPHLNTQLQASLLSTVACRPYLHPLNKSCCERRVPYLDWPPPPLSLCSRQDSKSQCEETEFLTLWCKSLLTLRVWRFSFCEFSVLLTRSSYQIILAHSHFKLTFRKWLILFCGSTEYNLCCFDGVSFCNLKGCVLTCFTNASLGYVDVSLNSVSFYTLASLCFHPSLSVLEWEGNCKKKKKSKSIINQVKAEHLCSWFENLENKENLFLSWILVAMHQSNYSALDTSTWGLGIYHCQC